MAHTVPTAKADTEDSGHSAGFWWAYTATAVAGLGVIALAGNAPFLVAAAISAVIFPKAMEYGGLAGELIAGLAYHVGVGCEDDDGAREDHPVAARNGKIAGGVAAILVGISAGLVTDHFIHPKTSVNSTHTGAVDATSFTVAQALINARSK
ncbi:MAG: hypothetical protein EYC62_04440 [Alphaproteobacteria bacterium]|nr:MAG: hypothetical protein EYC62_04440 [Alphaproteobacteria bacterium]